MSKKFLFIFLLLIALVVTGAWFFSQKKDQVAVETIEIAPGDSIKEETTLLDDSMVGDSMAVDSAGDNIAKNDVVEKSVMTGNEFVEKNTTQSIKGYVLSRVVSGASVAAKDHISEFSSSDKNLWLTVILDQGITDESINFILSYKKDNSALGPVKANVFSENGSKYAVFELQSPEYGWPVGSYLATIALPSGENVKVDLTVK